MMLLIMQSTPLTCQLIPLRPKFSSVPHSQITLLHVPPSLWETKFHTHTQQQTQL
jgi:hypothetical protein